MDNISPIDIPVELLGEIVKWTSRSDQLTLCITSKPLNAVAIRYLYRSIDLISCSHAQKLRCCQTLGINSYAALATRDLKINSAFAPSRRQAFFEAIASAFKSVNRLESLMIASFDPLFFPVLDKCTFPRLRDLKISIHLPLQSVGSFLLRHPDLQTLRILWPYKGYVVDDFASVSFPALTSFEGPGNIIPALLAKCPIEHVNIKWSDEDTDYEDVIATFGSAPIHTFSNHKRRWSLPLLYAISRHCSEVTSLNFKFGDEYGDNGGLDSKPNDLFKALNDILPLFKNLQSFSLRLLQYTPTMSGFHDQFETTVEWGHLCPKLSICALDFGIIWYRIADSVWFPCGDHLDSIRYNWVKEMIHSGKYPSMGLLSKMLEHGKILELNRPAIEVLHSAMQLDDENDH